MALQNGERNGRNRQKTDRGGCGRGGLCLLCPPEVWDTAQRMGGNDDT